MTGPGDEMAGGARGPGHLRASHADREQVIGVLKAAFVQGRLSKDELELRVGQALASRTYAELAAITADLPAGLPVAQPPMPARARRPGALIMAATAFEAGLWAFAPNGYGVLVFLITFAYIVTVGVTVGNLILDRQDKSGSRRRQRPRGQLPPRPGPDAGGQAAQRSPSVGPAGQLPPTDHGQHGADAAPSGLPRPRLPGSRSPGQWRLAGMAM
jgi:Domain of unknown function (DUF1707)